MLHHPAIHGKTEDSAHNIEGHYIVHYISGQQEEEEEERTSCWIEELDHLKRLCAKNLPKVTELHPMIRNYKKVAISGNPEIARVIQLPTQEMVAILKTCWLRIFQKKWRRVRHSFRLRQ